MRESFKAQISGKDQIVVRLTGPINEVADFEPIRFASLKPVEVDMGGVTGINSMGIRAFRDWANGLQNAHLTFSYCPKVFVDQLNMIPDLIPARAKVISFYVPYYSEESAEEKMVLYSSGQQFQVTEGVHKLSEVLVKDSSGQAMQMDVIREKYFRFLAKYG